MCCVLKRSGRGVSPPSSTFIMNKLLHQDIDLCIQKFPRAGDRYSTRQRERKMKEESKFDLLREMGGERTRKDTATVAVTSSLPRSCQADRTSCCSIQRRTRLRSRLASKGRNAARSKRIRINDGNDLNYSPLSFTIRLEFQ